MNNNSKHKKIYIGNRKEKYTQAKVVEFRKVRPYYRKVNFHQTKEEKKLKLSVILAITAGIIALYLGLMFFATKDNAEESVGVDTGIEQTVGSKEEADKILGFETVALKSIPDNFKQNYIMVDPTNKTFKIHFTIKEENMNQNNNILLLQEEKTLTPVQGTIDGYMAEYTSYLNNNNDLSSYTNSFNSKNNISYISWYENNYKFTVIGDVGIEGLSRFVAEILDKEVAFNLTSIKAN